MRVAIVSGAIANKPRNGGESWVRLSWLLGLRRLGFEAYFVELIDRGDCVGASGAPTDFADSLNRAYFEAVVREFGLEGRASLLVSDGEEAAGVPADRVADLAAEADLLVNLSGHLRPAQLLAAPRTSVYVDLDPGFTQVWHEDPAVPFDLPPHDHYVTVGLNLGGPDCPIPLCGAQWTPTLPPVVLERWPPKPQPPGPFRFSTVATWRSPSGALRIGGRTPGPKHHQFRRLIELPERVETAKFEIALDIHPADSADLEALRSHGWEVVDPAAVAGSPAASATTSAPREPSSRSPRGSTAKPSAAGSATALPPTWRAADLPWSRKPASPVACPSAADCSPSMRRWMPWPRRGGSPPTPVRTARRRGPSPSGTSIPIWFSSGCCGRWRSRYRWPSG